MAASQDSVDAVVEEVFLEWAERRGIGVEGDADGRAEYAQALARVAEARSDLADFAKQVRASRYPGILAAGIESHEEDLAQAEAEAERLQRTLHVETTMLDVVERWPTLPTTEKRAVLAGAIERVEIHPSVSHSRHVPFDALVAQMRTRLRIVPRVVAGPTLERSDSPAS